MIIRVLLQCPCFGWSLKTLWRTVWVKYVCVVVRESAQASSQIPRRSYSYAHVCVTAQKRWFVGWHSIYANLQDLAVHLIKPSIRDKNVSCRILFFFFVNPETAKSAFLLLLESNIFGKISKFREIVETSSVRCVLLVLFRGLWRGSHREVARANRAGPMLVRIAGSTSRCALSCRILRRI